MDCIIYYFGVWCCLTGLGFGCLVGLVIVGLVCNLVIWVFGLGLAMGLVWFVTGVLWFGWV